ncbi:hypothetical protein INT48_005351 [Thamnidium elegans]|uniref:Uncharacterized protein n=1 Tax=Thamnidium elegans TaxID=101142 RepID=A0A8H7SH01_9FUNG|nr:hypothetical protein INT48_005351 [Thamnidium elegans]
MLSNKSQNIQVPNGTDLQEKSLAGASKRVKDEYEYVVGIDFGTTYSGVAYSRVKDKDHLGRPIVFDIGKWPKHTSTIIKIPTRSVYKNGALIKWGDQVIRHKEKENVEILTMYKLLLSENNLYVDIPTLPLGFNITKVIADYLRELYYHTYNILCNVKGKTMDKSKVRFCLTVPAVWTEKAKIIMRDAAIEANIIDANDHQDRLLLVGEPEAAALYCNTMLNQYNLKHGATFLICDAGGGTVDLVVYRINDNEDQKYLIEVAAGDGGLCGSVNLDQRFKLYVTEQVKNLTGIKLTENELEIIVKDFITTHKENVTYPKDYATELGRRPVDEDDSIAIKLPSQFERIETDTTFILYIVDGHLNIPISEVRRVIFDPVVNEVLNLIQAQCNGVGKLDAIFLVGGFGQSDYLIGTIQARFRKDTEIIARPEAGQMAIVRGAVFMGLDPLFVKKRVIRRTYGYQCALEFDEIADSGRPRTEKGGAAYCNGRFLPYASKGEVKDIDHSVSVLFTGYYREKKQSIRLFAYDGDNDQLPRYTDDERVHEIIKFDIDMPELPNVHPDDTIDITVRFFLYQTEIKLEVTIGHSTKVYTGLYPRDTGSYANLIGGLRVTDDTSNVGIEPSYEQYQGRSNNEDENEIGIIGNIPEDNP